jgi:hypothetical protein
MKDFGTINPHKELTMKNPNNYPESFLIGKEHGKIVAYINITRMSNADLNILTNHWKSIGRTWVLELR